MRSFARRFGAPAIGFLVFAPSGRADTGVSAPRAEITAAQSVNARTKLQYDLSLRKRDDTRQAAFEKLIQQRTETVSQRHALNGEKFCAAHRYEACARELALSYALTPSDERLAKTAEALRRADLDREALTLYRRLLQETPLGVRRDELTETATVLRAKLGDAEDSSYDDFEVAALIRAEQERAYQRCMQGSYVDCSARYAQIYALKRLPRLLFNIAQADRRAEILDESVMFYTRFLQEAPPSPLRKEAAQYVSELGEVAFKRPLYKQWWLWTTVLGGVAVLTTASIAGGLANQRHDPQTDLGTQSPIFKLSY